MSDDGFRTLAAACDISVIRALELIGKRTARDSRSSFGAITASGTPWHNVHTMYDPTPSHVDQALKGAWSNVPRLVEDHGCCGVTAQDVQSILDDYVRELVSSRRAHTYGQLERRLRHVIR